MRDPLVVRPLTGELLGRDRRGLTQRRRPPSSAGAATIELVGKPAPPLEGEPTTDNPGPNRPTVIRVNFQGSSRAGTEVRPTEPGRGQDAR